MASIIDCIGKLGSNILKSETGAVKVDTVRLVLTFSSQSFSLLQILKTEITMFWGVTPFVRLAHRRTHGDVYSSSQSRGKSNCRRRRRKEGRVTEGGRIR